MADKKTRSHASNKKRSSPKRQPNKAAAKPSWNKRLLSLGLKCSLVGIAAVVMLGIYLDGKIQDRFSSGQIWQLPGVVYGRVINLSPGSDVSLLQLRQQLDALNYQKVRTPKRPGEYSASQTRLEIIRRPFDFEDGPAPARHAMLSFGDNQVNQITDVSANQSLGLLRIEPKLLGMMESGINEQRLFLPRERFPEFLVEALLTTEDRDFYHHEGVSPSGILRAFVANIRAGRTVQGGSTLTQQLAKNLFLTRDRTLWRKAQEAYMALILDFRYSKDKLLEAYFNEVYLGQNRGEPVHGFPLGARLYFGRPISELRVDQLALLVGMVKGPSYYNPFRHPERAKSRRDLVLRLMLEQNRLSSADYQAAASRPLDIQKTPTLSRPQPAYFDQLKEEIRHKVGDKYAAGAGLRIFTTLDPVSQQAIERAVTEKVKALKHRAGNQLEAAAVIADRRSGEVRAMVGGARPGFAGFNRALNAKRAIGSLAKPAVYLTALNQPERFQLTSNIDDKPIRLEGSQGSSWQPRNYDRQYRGTVSLLTALAKSYNVPTVNLGMQLGLENVVNTFGQLGAKTDTIPRVPSLLLGAFSMSPFEVTQVYQTLGNAGQRAPLTALRAVTTKEGQGLYQNWPKAERVVPEQAGWLTLYAMKQVVKQGTGRFLQQRHRHAALAGKTGTTDDNRDSWFVGIDDKEVTTVWLGRDDNQSTGLTGASGALRVYDDYLNRRGATPLALPWPADITTVAVSQQGSQYALNCRGETSLPVWDINGQFAKRCRQPDPVGWLKGLFN
ncbi:penicillin-binding protein 1B [Salinivibrio costicola]|uniref:Penicillin-binding protein 1B n=1 Tax=Salinivibrio costicola subsp. alcaliphilus TaxID=272773 RepID=A0ABX3KT54_SALCS|nr:penicillin-binding protein 1B [Salinivibrio costicola]OOF34769.1 penicillin-binding protein 1B [Salinivibrio costicola subsp. alcaliphilus]